jgi:hypothetical protein
MPLPEIDRSVELFSLPGHDRECAVAMLSQARLRTRPLDDLQVAHLISIGYSAGVAAGEVRGRTAAAANDAPVPADAVTAAARDIAAWYHRVMFMAILPDQAKVLAGLALNAAAPILRAAGRTAAATEIATEIDGELTGRLVCAWTQAEAIAIARSYAEGTETDLAGPHIEAVNPRDLIDPGAFREVHATLEED